MRAWKGWKPTAGSIASFRIAFGSLAATSSMSMPPWDEAMNTGLPRGAVDHDREVHLLRALEVHALLDQQAPHDAALGPGLVRAQRHAEHRLGERLALLGGPGQLDAAALAAAAGVDLRLDHDREAQLLADLDRLVAV